MYVTVDVSQPIPPWVNKSYGNFGFWKLGLGAWLYSPGTVIVNDAQLNLSFTLGDSVKYLGEIEWINTLKFLSYPKYNNPIGFRTWFQKGVIATVTLHAEVKINVPDVTINAIPRNLLTGKNMPMLPNAP